MLNRLIKVSFTFAALFLLSASLMSAQATQAKWSGVHVGVLGGTAAGTYNNHYTDGSGGLDNEDFSFAGGRVGINAGYDFDFHGVVVGAMADWSWSNARFKEDESDNTGDYLNQHATMKQMTTIRGRVGHSYGRVLPYVHGGLLIGDTELKLEGTGQTTLSGSNEHNGFVVGAGIEYFVAPHWSLNPEYGYNHITGIPVPAAVTGGSSILITQNIRFSTMTVGFNYHF